jgi:hypothetical protein
MQEAGFLRYVLGLAVLVLLLGSRSAFAWPCDFMTGGGFIFSHGAKANFGVAGGCKKGLPTWGHLEYKDHGTGLEVHWTSITGYFEEDTSTDSNGKPIGSRLICGTASTNLYGDVDFVVRVRDAGEPGVNDWFDIRLRRAGATEPCAPGNGGGGNIQLHKPNPSTTGAFGGTCAAL